MKHTTDSFIDDIIKEISQKDEKNPDFDRRLKNVIQKLILARPEIHADEMFKQNLRKRLVALAQYPKVTHVKKSWVFYFAPLFTCFAVFGFSYHFFFTSSLQDIPLKKVENIQKIEPALGKEPVFGEQKEEGEKQKPILKKSLPKNTVTPKITHQVIKQDNGDGDVKIQNNLKEDTQIIDILGNVQSEEASNNANIPISMFDAPQLEVLVGGVGGSQKILKTSLDVSNTGVFEQMCIQKGGELLQSGSDAVCRVLQKECSAIDYENHICNFDEIK